MNVLLNCLFVGCGGMLGAVARYLMGFLPLKPQNGFPAGTMLINVIGAFFIGLIAALAGKYGTLNPHLVLFLKVGICGGFTTFSTFSLEALGLLQSGKCLLGAAYMVTQCSALCSSCRRWAGIGTVKRT